MNRQKCIELEKIIYSILFPMQDFLQLYNVISDWTPGEDQVLSFHSKAGDTPGDFIRRSRPSDFRPRLLGTHLAIFFADRGDAAVSKSDCDKITQPDGLTSLAIRSDDRGKSRERAHLVNAGEFNRRYLTCQISAIFYADRGDRRKSQSPLWAHLAIFADRGDRRIKSPSVSPA